MNLGKRMMGKRDREAILIPLAVSVILLIPITDQSLWIDEAWTAYFVAQDDLWELWERLARGKYSDILTPFYLIYMRLWSKGFGLSEYSLRMANFPFGFLFVVAVAWVSREVFQRRFLWMTMVLSPFVWFYLNEARVYAATIGLSAMATAALFVYYANHDKYRITSPWVCLLFLFLSIGFNILAGFLGLVLFFFMFLENRKRWISLMEFARDWGKSGIVFSPLFLGLGVFLFWGLKAGAGDYGKVVGMENLGLVFYEFMGFMGLGPPRNLLRIDQSISTFATYWPWVLIGIVGWAFLLGQILCRKREAKIFGWSFFLAFFFGVVIFFITAKMLGFRFYGRHLAIFFPLFIYSILIGLGNPSTERSFKRWEALAIAGLAIVWLCSSYRLWGVQEYHKEDYRTAARIAVAQAEANKGEIVWVADELAGRYYGVEFDHWTENVKWKAAGKAISGIDWDTSKVKRFMISREKPIILVLSKPDLYDRKGGWRANLESMKWEKIAAPNYFEIFLMDPDRFQGFQLK